MTHLIAFLAGAASLGLCLSLRAERWDIAPYFGLPLVLIITVGLLDHHE